MDTKFVMRKEPDPPQREVVCKVKPISEFKKSIASIIEWCNLNKIDIESATIEKSDYKIFVKWKELEDEESFQKKIDAYKRHHDKWKLWCAKHESEIKDWIEKEKILSEKAFLEHKAKLDSIEKKLTYNTFV